MIIRNVRRGSPASVLELAPGDELVSMNGSAVRDLIDYRFHGADEMLELAVRAADGTERVVTLEKDPDLDLGIEFEPAAIRECHNKCPFCFVDQSPPGVRPELDIRDDDYLLSFEHGHFVTLTNLKEWEFDRIVEQRLSPLYVSVHATDPDVRVRMLIHKNAGRIMELLRQLAEGGIQMHTQAVVCPGWNDGAVLDETISDLASLHPAVETMSVVPVGLTAHREGLPHIDSVTPGLARVLLDQTHRWQETLAARLGTRFVFPSDELFLLADERVPAMDYYEDGGQEENGVGMTRAFLDEWDDTRTTLRPRADRPRRVAWVTGTMAAPVIEREVLPTLRAIGEVDVRLVVVENAFYGPSVTCAGLLAGADIARAVGGPGLADTILLPGNILNDNDLFVDSMPLTQLSERVGGRVLVATNGLTELLRDAGLSRG